MDIKDKNIFEFFLRRINNCTLEELNNIKIVISNDTRGIKGGIDKREVYMVSEETCLIMEEALQDKKSVVARSEHEKNKEYAMQNKELEIMLENHNIEGKIVEFMSTNKRHPHKKARVKNKPKKSTKNKKYKDNKGRKIKSIIGTIILGGGILAGGVGLANNIKEYNVTAATVENLKDSQIEEQAENIILQKISEATNVKAEDIIISDEWNDSSTCTTTVIAGNDEYKYMKDYRGYDIFNNNTLSGKVADLISKVKNAKGRTETINALKEVEKFSKNSKITIKDNKLVDESTDRVLETTDGEER